jgi:hypothetical protein
MTTKSKIVIVNELTKKSEVRQDER